MAELQKLANARAERFLASLTDSLGSNLGFLRRLKMERRGAQELHPLLLSDLLANARRRMEEGKFDDAAARLYRLVEMIGQIEIQRLCGAKTDNFPREEVPEALREEYEHRYRDEKGKLKLPLEATYRVLSERGSDTGRRFFQDRGRFSNLQQARNLSILAHGVTPIEEGRVRELLEFVSSLMPLQDEPRFPKLKAE